MTNDAPSTKKTKKPKYIAVYEYFPEISAYNVPYNKGEDPDLWVYSLTLICEQKDYYVIDIRPQNQYTSYEEALMDAYGCIELLGFHLKKQIPVEIFYWNPELDDYEETKKYFDGKDFYQEDPNPKEDEDDERKD